MVFMFSCDLTTWFLSFLNFHERVSMLHLGLHIAPIRGVLMSQTPCGDMIYDHDVQSI